VRSGLITLDQLQAIPLFDDFCRQTLQEYPHLGGAAQGRRLLYEIIRRMLSAQVYDVIDATGRALERAAPDSADAARAQPPLLCFSEDMREKSVVLKKFLLENLYRHQQVMRTTGQARQVIRNCCSVQNCAQEMQAGFVARTQAARGTAEETALVLRVVADYIAG